MRGLKTTAVLVCLLLAGCGAAPAPTPSPNGYEREFTDAAEVSSHYRTWLPDGAPEGVLFVLDGDGQWGYDHPDDPYLLGGPEGVVAAGTRHGLAVVAVRTPEEGGTWWEDGETDADYLHAAPYPTPVRRLDEGKAARQPVLRYDFEDGAA